MIWWLERWQASKAESAFGSLSEQIKISYLKFIVLKEILLAVDYTKYEAEGELLDALMDYFHDIFHPLKLRQLEVLRKKQESGTKTCNHLRVWFNCFISGG